MRKYDYEVLVDGLPILDPDEGVTLTCEDLDSSESGRDESGVMHRIVLREAVKKVTLTYSFLSREDYLYMESLFKGKAQFEIECRDFDGSKLCFTAYRSKHGITIQNVRTGVYKNYSFSIIEC